MVLSSEITVSRPWKVVKNGVRTVGIVAFWWGILKKSGTILEDFEPKSVVFATKILAYSRIYGDGDERYS